MSNFTYQTEEEVMFFDTDIGGVVHNLAYLRMIESCRTKLATALGFDLKVMAEIKVFPVVVSTEIHYKRPATLGDHLLLTGSITSFKFSSFHCSFTIKDKHQKSLLYTTCQQKLAVVQMPEAKPVRIPDRVLSKLQNMGI